MTDHDLVNNLSTKLDDAVALLLSRSGRAHFVLGHLFLPGLAPIIDSLGHLEVFRCLIGNTTHSDSLEQLFERYVRTETVKSHVERQLFPRRPDLRRIVRKAAEDLRESIALLGQTDEFLVLLKSLRILVEQGRVEIRIYPRGRLSTKAYLFEPGSGSLRGQTAAPALAVLGTTNLTHAHIAHPAELNVVVHGEENYAEIRRWFESLWDQSEDFGHLLIEAIRSSWASDETRPYDIYMKTLYSLLKDRLDDDASREILWDDEIVDALADYQKVAVRQAVQMIRDYGGAFVADVVGLGKSFVGAAILKQFERNDRARGLIVCPASLVPMWERYNEHYQLNARVVSTGLLREDGPRINILLDDDRFRHRDFVLIDESHNYRNSDTQRYRTLQQFLAAGKKCCLLTATPRNKSCWDVFNQIKLFHQEDKTDLPIAPPNLREYFRLIERGDRSLPELLSNILIRRTRSHIVKWYGFDAETNEKIDLSGYAEYRSGRRRCYVKVAGKRQFFPKRELHTIEYSIEDTYQGIYRDLRAAIGVTTRPCITEEPTEGLTFARYAVGRYLRREKQDDPRYSRLRGATASLHGLIRILLFKRFESSVEAFRQTVVRMIASHQNYRHEISQGHLPWEANNELVVQTLGEGAELDDFSGNERTGTPVCGLEDFHREFLLRDLDHDLCLLRRILDLVLPITADQDAKLAVLLRRLVEPPLVGRKVLIFTEYTDTAQYLYSNLNPLGLDRRIEVVHSGVGDYGQIVGRFAPRSNPTQRGPETGPEIMTLIATDVLSEGMNLQDCDTIVNYDLHWNPVRLIQRFGRIDRIGTTFDTIQGFNFLPEVGLERTLGLRQRLQNRIQEIHDTIGEDSAILESTERLNESVMYAIYEPSEATEVVFEEVEAADGIDLNEAEEMLRLLRREDEAEFERIANLPDGIRSGKRSSSPGTYVLCRAGRYHRAYILDPVARVITSDMPSILGEIKCGPELPPVPLSASHGRNVIKAKQMFEIEFQNRAVEREQIRTLGTGQRYVVHELRRLVSELTDEESRARILLFDEIFREAVSNSVRRELNLIRRNGINGPALLAELSRIYQDHRLRNHPSQPERDLDTSPRLVCSMSLG